MQSTKQTYFVRQKKSTTETSFSKKFFIMGCKQTIFNKLKVFFNENITVENRSIIVTDDRKLAPIFNHHYVDIVEQTTIIAPGILKIPETKKRNQ